MASAPPPAKFMECCEVTWSDRANCGQRGARGVSPSWDALGREKKMLEAMGLPDSPKLTKIDVHKRYLKLAKRLHPDAGGTPDAAKFALVTGVCPRFAGRAARTGVGGGSAGRAPSDTTACACKHQMRTTVSSSDFKLRMVRRRWRAHQSGGAARRPASDHRWTM